MRAAVLCLVASALMAQPRFSPDRVLPANSTRHIALEPGMIMSIYGEELGPAEACTAYNEPTQLCGVQVLVGSRLAEVLYASPKQINFRVPRDMEVEGTTSLRVVFNGESSMPFNFPLGLEKMRLFLEQPAFVGTPVWLQVEFPLMQTGSIQYPYILGPAGFGCNKVEVRRNGIAIKQIPEADWFRGGIAFSGNPCGSYGLDAPPGKLDRLPLHLLYRFEVPGTYEVRLNQSEWSKIEIQPARPNQRKALLAEARDHPPPTSGAILGDFLPSILGFPDDESFDILAGYLYHPFQAVRRYAQHGLSYWPDELVRTRLLRLLTTKGPSDEVIARLSWPQEFFKVHAAEIVRASLPYVESDSPVLRQGGIRGITGLFLFQTDPATVQLVIDAAEKADAVHAPSYIDALGTTQDPRAHELLWKWQGQGIGADRPIFSLAHFKDPADLPKLGAALLATKDNSVPYYIHTNFGDSAVPYLEAALTNSADTLVRIHCAEELITARRPSGFAFFAEALGQNRTYNQQLVQFLKDRFPELKNADYARLQAFVIEKSASGTPRP